MLLAGAFQSIISFTWQLGFTWDLPFTWVCWDIQEPGSDPRQGHGAHGGCFRLFPGYRSLIKAVTNPTTFHSCQAEMNELDI